jgi:hypothetical protein
MIAVSDATTITISVVGFLAFLAIVALARVLLRSEESRWRKVRLGFFIERNHVDDDRRERLEQSKEP